MALPSIVLLVTFVVSCAASSLAFIAPEWRFSNFYDGKLHGFALGLAAVAASALHWLRFHVPITIAAFAAGLAAIATTVIDYLQHGT